MTPPDTTNATADMVAYAPVTCPNCGMSCQPNVSFCTECGKALVANVKPRRSKIVEARSEIAKKGALKSIRGARIALGFVAVVTLLFTLFQHNTFSNDIAAARANPGLEIDEAIVSQVNLLFMINYGLVAVFIGLLFWTKKNPFAACLTGLILYATIILVNAAFDPATIIQGIIVKIIIIISLLHGVRAGLAYRRLHE